MKSVFNGRAEKVATAITNDGVEAIHFIGRCNPGHVVHEDCMRDILASGKKLVRVIGSDNKPDNKFYDPLKNPLTVEQQIEQLKRAMPDVAAKAIIFSMPDVDGDQAWIDLLKELAKENGAPENAAMYFRSKAADAQHAKDEIKPMSHYQQYYIDNGFSVWESYNSNAAHDSISATDIRKFDLNNMTEDQRSIIQAPDYIVQIARAARDANPAKWMLDGYKIPLTTLDLSLDRIFKETGISTADLIKNAAQSGPVTLDSITSAAASAIKHRNVEGKQPILLVGNSVSPETASILAEDGMYDVVTASIGKFQSGEHFVEILFDAQSSYKLNAEKIRGAKVTLVQSTGDEVGDNVQYLLQAIHTLKNYGASEVDVVVPFAAYSREDRAFEGRFTSIGADLFAKQLKAAGADKILTFTIHSADAAKYYQNTFGDNFISMTTTDIFAGHARATLPNNGADAVNGGPDGAEKLKDLGQRRARDVAQDLTGRTIEEGVNDPTLFRIGKTHTGTNDTKITSFEGDVAGKDCNLIDDMADGGGTLVNAGTLLMERGAKSRTAYITHAILTDGKVKPRTGLVGKLKDMFNIKSSPVTALERILLAKVGDEYVFNKLVMTDSIPESAKKVAAFRKKYPQLSNRIEVIPLGHAILAEMKKQLAPAVKTEPVVKTAFTAS